MFNFFKKKSKEETPALFFHTDIHCHLVPGIDDGQKTAEGGADLVRHEKNWGVKRIILTPHVTQDTFENDAPWPSLRTSWTRASSGRGGA